MKHYCQAAVRMNVTCLAYSRCTIDVSCPFFFTEFRAKLYKFFFLKLNIFLYFLQNPFEIKA